jgi:hypothetical protein
MDRKRLVLEGIQKHQDKIDKINEKIGNDINHPKRQYYC